MKQDIAEYLVSSFTDFKGVKHQVVICALSQHPEDEDFGNLEVYWEYGNEEPLPTYRMLSIGIAICNPVDTFDEETGKKIALGKAKFSKPRLIALEKGVINTKLVKAFLSQEADFISRYPGKFIDGYDESKERWEESKLVEKEVKKLTNDEATIVQAILDGVDFEKCLDLAKKLKKHNVTKSN